MNEPLTTAARPFVKFVGGKRQLLPELDKHVPATFGHYWEPFVGGAALFYHLRAAGRLRGASLFDANEFLINTYVAIRDNVDVVILWLRGHEQAYKSAHTDEAKLAYYLSVRAAMGTPGNFGPKENEAARLIFCNKTGYNGLFRVNGKGRFNVPHGRNANPTICDEENLRACSLALQNVDIRREDFAVSELLIKAGDLVYYDPPYVKVSDTADFTSYTADKFNMVDQERLRDLAWRLRSRGVHVILSNADMPVARELYKRFEVHEVQAKRNINRDAAGRGKVGELIIT